MFKFKKEIKYKYSLPGSFVGVIFSNREDGPIMWKMLEWNNSTEKYHRSLTNDEDSSMSNIHTYHTYSHKHIQENIQKNSWVIRKDIS